MDTTILLAKIVGILCIIAGLSMFFRRNVVVEVFEEVMQNRGLVYLLGIIEIMLGLLIVFNHNVWSGGAVPVIITIIGWMAIIEGIFYVFVSRGILRTLFSWYQKKTPYYVISIISLVIGIYLTYVGFSGV